MSKTVIIKLAGLGDILMATPSLRAYKKSFPENFTYFVVGESNYSVLKNNPYIDDLIRLNDKALFAGSFVERSREVFKLLNILNSIKPDEIFILHRDWRYNLISFFSRIPNRYGFKRDIKGLFLTKSVKTYSEQHEIYKYLSIFSLKKGFKSDGIAMDICISKNDLRIVEEYFQILPQLSPVIAVAPGGASNVKEEMEARRWPLEYYSKLIRLLLKDGVSILLVGGQSDIQFTKKLSEEFKKIDGKQLFDIAGKFTIQETYCALQKCSLMITHDCGPMHIGASAGIPVVSLFGPTFPLEKIPITNDKSLYFWQGDQLDCSPCYNNGRFPRCAYKICMYSITPEKVYEKIIMILNCNLIERVIDK